MSSAVPDAAVYDAARGASIVLERDDLTVIRVFGRDPVRMVQGLITNDLNSLPAGGATYAALLTPKGRMLADVRVIRRETDVLIVCDDAAATNVRDTLRRFVPPLFARAEDAGESLRLTGVYGPASTELVGRVLEADPAGGAAADAFAGTVAALGEDDGTAAGFRGTTAWIIRDGDAGVDGWLIVCDADQADGLRETIAETAVPADGATLETLRIEAGRPRWNAELAEDVIPLEAGLRDRAISTSKGCYTGQEVIIRVLHRGHVNRRLLGLRLGASPVPERGTELYEAGGTKVVARVTSACVSPLAGETIALAYVRREIEPGATLRLGAPDGPDALVASLPFSAPTTA